MIKININEINEINKLKEIIWLLEILEKKNIEDIINDNIKNIDQYSEIDKELINIKINILKNMKNKKYLNKKEEDNFIIYEYNDRIDIYIKKKIRKEELINKISYYNSNSFKLLFKNKEIKKEDCEKYDHKYLKMSIMKE